MTNWTLAPVRAVALLTLAACNPSNPPATATEEQTQELILSCTAFQYTSADALEAAYGAENIIDEIVPGPEGEDYTATILYPNDPMRRLEIVWQDAAARINPAAITVSGEESAWRGPNALSLGQSLAEVEAINRNPFMLTGFQWDYAGTVTDWRDGAFAPAEGCMTRVRFNPTGDENGAIGDGEFASDSPEVRRAAPIVSEFSLVFPSRL